MSNQNLHIKPDGRSIVTYETTSVEIFMDPTDNSGRLSSLFSVSRGKGYATGLLTMICEWADENDVYLWLVAKPYGRPRDILDQKQLMEFYGRFGFIPKPQFDVAARNVMHRRPLERG